MTSTIVKKVLLALALIILGIASYVTNKFIPVQGINNVFFVPVMLCIYMLFNSNRPILKLIIASTLGGLIYIIGSNLFRFEPIMSNGAWCLVGGVITYLSTLLYRYIKKEGAKEVKNEIAEAQKTNNEKDN